MLRALTCGGTVHYIDVEAGLRMRVPGPGRGCHYGDGGWLPMTAFSGFENGSAVEAGEGVRLLFVASDDSWFLTSPVVALDECASVAEAC